MKSSKLLLVLWLLFIVLPFCTLAEDDPELASSDIIFDDKMLLEGYVNRYEDEPKEMLLAIIQDETLTSYKTAAAVRVFRERFSQETVSREKNITERILLRRLNTTDSSFVQVEIMHTLCLIDRYRYFKSMVPALLQKLDHYNETVNDMAYNSLKNVLAATASRSREARIVFNTLRKMLFLSRKRLADVTEPGPRLKQKLELLRWSVKILGTEELKRLPKEVINLL
jgi:hypothetical protein